MTALGRPIWPWLVFGLIGPILLSACGRSGADNGRGADGTAALTPPPIPVEVAEARRETLSAAFQGTASLEAEAEAQVVAKTSGVVLEILAEEGQTVTRDQIMARLDSERQRLAVRQSEATLRKLENDFRRTQELYERKLVGQDAFDRIRFDLDNQKAAFELAKLELSYTEVRAPIAGVVSKRAIKIGNFVNVNQTLFKIDDFDPVLAVVNVPEREMGVIAPGQPVRMVVDAIDGVVFEGVVARVSPVVDVGTGTFRVTAEFRDPQARLRSGMFGRLSIVHSLRLDALVIPRAALLAEGAEAAVYAVVDDQVRRTPVRLGYVGDGKAEVLEGLSEGTQVVTLGQAAVRDGARVQVLAR